MVDHPSTQARRNILAVIEEPETTRQCLMGAASAATTTPLGVVTALHIEVDPAKIRTAPEEISVQQLREVQEGSAHDRAIQIQRIFEFWLAANPSVYAQWRKIIGTVDANVTRQAQTADLIVLGQPHNLDSADALHAAIFHSGKPVLFLPRGPLRDITFDHLAIAWKDTPQANKAIRQTQPWLGAASRLSVLTVDEPGTTRNTRPVEQWMREHDLSFELHHLACPPNAHVATALLTAAEQIDADALVMGAYRFGQILEWVFGGVTSEILQRSTLPVFLAH